MTQEAIKQINDGERPNPNLLQGLASDPAASVWVGASAGTGKTKVLTDRVLRLLLPKPGRGLDSATAPEKILCITFTKTAAAEMAQRIQSVLSGWAVADDKKLEENLRKVTGDWPDADMVTAARRLFAKVVDTPGGLRIMTIHSFCQSVLQRFPVEAGLPPHFEMLDEQTAIEYLTQCQHRVIREAKEDKDGALDKAFQRLAGLVDAGAMRDLMQDISGRRSLLARILDAHGGTEGAIQALYQRFDLSPDVTVQQVLEDFGNISADIERDLRRACALLAEGTVIDQKTAAKIQPWLENPKNRVTTFALYKSAFLTNDNEKRKTLATKGTKEKWDGLEDLLRREQERVLACYDRTRDITFVEMNADLLTVTGRLLDLYGGRKKITGRLDFDDLIIETRKLLQEKVSSAWVMFKLDGGIDHILVDEAQDTNPDQWRVIQALADDFFAGVGAREDVERTIFVVGDEKQSIFSFQRADPAEFERMHDYFKDRIRTVEKELRRIDLGVSFRSVRSVLHAVDTIFAEDHVRNGVVMKADRLVKHDPFRVGQAGLVEVWPLFAEQKSEDKMPWQAPVASVTGDNARARLARHIASSVRRWIDTEKLESANRPVRAGDIMILVKNRNVMVDYLVRALKAENVPVAGVDRMMLADHIAVMDLCACANFALLPEDDLTLATVLKTPLVGLSEDDLFDICHARPKNQTVWQAVQKKRPDVAEWLSDLVQKAPSVQPYTFFAEILGRSCPADDTSGRRAFLSRLGLDVLDPMDEFLNMCLSFEMTHIPSLQLFLNWFVKGEAEIKREQDPEKSDSVRIMTVHASKGLQAPIVIIPDAAAVSWGTPKSVVRTIWPEDENDVLLWSPRSTLSSGLFDEKKKTVEEKAKQEYRRLMYVALTRAQDRLYVCGVKTRKQKNLDPDSWYSLISESLKKLPETEQIVFESGGKEVIDPETEEPLSLLRLYHPQTKEPDGQREEQQTESRIEKPLPDWVFEPALAEPERPQPLVPSHADEESESPPVQSPLGRDDGARFRRGNLIHQMLEVLPGIATEKRLMAAKTFLSVTAPDIEEDKRNHMAEETVTVLSHPDFAAIFGAGSRAEVPVVGLIDATEAQKLQVLSGQIDRLLVTEKEVLVIDFKTNRPPPRDEKDVPDIYRKQMASYRRVLQRIYPDLPVKCALLWTDGPFLMPLSEETLDAADMSSTFNGGTKNGEKK